MTKNNICIVCALTHVPRGSFEIYSEHLHALAHELETNCNAEVFYALKHSDPQMATLPFRQRAKYCFERDVELVKNADVLVAECTFPSIGLGIELQTSNFYKKPLILLYDEGDEHRARPVRYKNPDGSEHDLQIGEGYITLMALGLPNIINIIMQKITNRTYTTIVESVRGIMSEKGS